MASAYSIILIPVDFSTSTEAAVTKALEVANGDGAIIYLLHVLPQSMRHNEHLRTEISNKLNQLKAAIPSDLYHTNTIIQYHDSIQKSIAETAKHYHADLIVVGKKSAHWLPFTSEVSAGVLAEETGKPVLTVKPGSAQATTKTIVVPVGEKVPYEKMEAIASLCQALKLRVHLVTFQGKIDGHTNSASALLHVYQWLKSTVTCHVEYAVLDGTNKMKSLLHYTQLIEANMVLLYPGAETKTGWLNRPLPDILPADSKLQVLAVQPQNN